MSFRKAYGALKDTTKVGLAKVNSEFKDLDIAIVKATNHVELPPKERHIRKIFSATSLIRPRADVAYCIHTLSKRLSKTKSWIVALKTLIVIHRTLREGDPTFREELLNYSHRGHVLQISNFKDDSSPLAWDCSAWVRTYAQYLEERLECFRVLKYDIESERLMKNSPGSHKVHSKTRILNGEQLLKQLPALQQLMYRLISCHPEGAAYTNHLIQYALALVLKESFKVYCAINDGIINLVDVFFDMSKHDAIKALNIYKRAGQQAENLADLYDHCRSLEMARNFQFPTLRQPPPSFLQTMEEYIKEAPQTGSVNNRLEYQEQELIDNDEQEEPKENHKKPVEDKEEMVKTEDEAQPKEEVEEPPFIATEEDKDTEGDLLGFASEINPKALELEESNALALAILPNGNDQSSTFSDLSRLHDSEWELALVTAPNNNSNTNRASQPKLGGGFDKLLLDSLYEDDSARRNLQIQNSGYGLGHGYEMSVPNPFEQRAQIHDPFMMSNNFAPPTNVQMMLAQQQHQQMLSRQQQQFYPQQQNMVPYNYQSVQQHMQPTTSNPFGDPFSFPPSTAQQRGNQNHGGLL